jgi:hypothetical protein
MFSKSVSKKLLFCFIFVFSIIIFSNSVSSAEGGNFTFEIDEDGYVIDYYNEYYIVNVQGTLSIKNNYNLSLYGLRIPLNMNSLSVGVADNVVRGNSLHIPSLKHDESTSFKYRIYGIITDDYLRNIKNLDNMSIMRFMIDDAGIEGFSDMVIALSKSNLNSKKNHRFIGVRVDNPTNLEYRVQGMHIIKTRDENINDEEYRFSITNKSVIYGYETWETSVQDNHENLKYDDVYWFFADLKSQNFEIYYDDNYNLERLNQDDLGEIDTKIDYETQGGSGSGNYDSYPKFFLRKSVNVTRVIPGDLINITIIATNLEQQSKVVTITDLVPDGFALVSSTDDTLKSDYNLQWTREINKQTSKIISYVLKFTDNESVGLFYLPEAKAEYDKKQVYSEKVPVIKKFIPSKKLYLQKSIRKDGKDEFIVTIKIRNMGDVSLNDLVIKEFLTRGSKFYEITTKPEDLGVWSINSIEKSGEWVVEYKTNDHDDLYSLPSIYGLDDIYVLKTIIKEDIVANFSFIPGMNFVEFVGFILLILCPFIIFYFWKFNKNNDGNETIRN